MNKDLEILKNIFNFIQGREEANNEIKHFIGDKDLKELDELLTKERGRPPKVAVIGKAGVGKTTTINNLFNANLKTSHALAGTKTAYLKEFELSGGGSLAILDMPGLGEDLDEDQIYEQIYRDELPKVDIILYILQANERILGEDQRIINDVVLGSFSNFVLSSKKEIAKRIIIGLNKVDLIGPGAWDNEINCPSDEQEISIDRRCNDITQKLLKLIPIRKKNMVYYSAEKRYRLYNLLIAIIKATGNIGWKLPVNPKPWWELASPNVQKFVHDYQNKG